MLLRKRPPGFIVPAQPVQRNRPPIGPNWVHEIKHDGYRLIVRRQGETVRLFTRRGIEWTARFPAIAAATRRIEAGILTIDGEAVICGPDGLARFDDLRRWDCGPLAMLWAFDLIALDGADLWDSPFLERKTRLAELLRPSRSAIALNEHIDADGTIVFEHACRLGAEGIVSKRIDASYRSDPFAAWIKVKNPAAIEVQRMGVRIGVPQWEDDAEEEPCAQDNSTSMSYWR